MSKRDHNLERYYMYLYSRAHPVRTGHEIVSDLAKAYRRLKEMLANPATYQGLDQVINPSGHHETEQEAPHQTPYLHSALPGDSQRPPNWLGQYGPPSGDRVGQYYKFDSNLDYDSKFRQDLILRNLWANHGQWTEQENRQVSNRQTNRADLDPVIWWDWAKED